MFEVPIAHEKELRNQGMGPLVDFSISLVEQMRTGIDEFDLDLRSLGDDTSICFIRKGDDRYTAIIPEEYRSKFFDTERTFPFALRR